jgi:hypothetical protein
MRKQTTDTKENKKGSQTDYKESKSQGKKCNRNARRINQGKNERNCRI